MARILLVDVDPVSRRSLAQGLRTAGYDVVAAADGRRAMAIMAQQDFAVAICEINMPEMDGFEVIRAMAVAGTKVPVIVMSGDEGLPPELVARCASLLGAPIQLRRPFSLPELEAAVALALAPKSADFADPPPQP